MKPWDAFALGIAVGLGSALGLLLAAIFSYRRPG